jgi:hypothetical protein
MRNFQQTIAMIVIMSVSICVSYGQPYLDLAQGMFSGSPGSDGQPRTSNHLRAAANLPIISKKDSSYFLFNPIWDQRWIQQSEASTEYAVQGLITWFNYTRNFGKKWAVQVSAIPRWMGVSSLQFSEGFQMGGAVLVTRKIRPGLKYQFGVYYNKELFGNFFLPLLGIDWKINDRMNLFGILPGYLTYEHRLGKKFSWGGNFRTFTSTYRLDTKGFTGADDYLRVQDNQVGVYSDWYIAPKIVLNVEAGHTIMRRIATGVEAVGGKDNETVVSEKDNFYFRATLQYRLRFR